MAINIQDLINEQQCYETVRTMRWPNGVLCVNCKSSCVKRNGRKVKDSACQKYVCNDCGKNFDDLTGTIFTGHHQPLRTWIICLYFMGLNLSNRQIAQELDLCESDVFNMTTLLREGIVQKAPKITLSGEVEMDEVYIIAGHKGRPDKVKKKGEKADAIG